MPVKSVASNCYKDYENLQVGDACEYAGLKAHIAGIDEIHEINFQLLSEFDRVCKKHNIEYFLAYGGLLGSVRHGDFIPWDDDVDVWLKVEEYEKLKQVAESFGKDYLPLFPDNEDQFFWDYIGRISAKQTLFTLQTDKNMNEYYRYHNAAHVSLDLFLLDKTVGGWRSKIQKFKLKVLFGMSMSRTASINRPWYTLTRKIQANVLRTAGKLFSMKSLFNAYMREGTKYHSRQTDYIYLVNMAHEAWTKPPFKKEWFDGTTDTFIRGVPFPAPKGYKELLPVLYGDYMTPPPESDRIPQHAQDFRILLFDDETDF